MIAVFFFITHEKGFKIHAQPQLARILVTLVRHFLVFYVSQPNYHYITIFKAKEDYMRRVEEMEERNGLELRRQGGNAEQVQCSYCLLL